MLRNFEIEVTRPEKKPFKSSFQVIKAQNGEVQTALSRAAVDVARKAGLRQQETFDKITAVISACRTMNGEPFVIEIDPNYSVIISGRNPPGFADTLGYDLDLDKNRSGIMLG